MRSSEPSDPGPDFEALMEGLERGIEEDDTEPHLAEMALAGAGAVGLDLVAAKENAQLFIANFPPSGLPLGDVDERAARWLAQLLEEPAIRARLREKLSEIASSHTGTHPRAAGQLAAWVAGEPPADPTRDEPWLSALQELARRELLVR